MPGLLSATTFDSLGEDVLAWATWSLTLLKVVIGFSIIIFIHELGHFLAAKWVGVRIDRFAVGFGPRLFGYRKGEGFRLGKRPEYTAEQIRERGYGETDYCFNSLPFGGYVKMLGQDDIVVDEKTEEITTGDDPRSFPNRPVGQRMVIASAGVVFNLVFAFLLLMAVFLLGLQQEEPVVGDLQPNSQAIGKLFSGDRVLAVNGTKVNCFKDIYRVVVFSDGDLRYRVERNGTVLPEEIVVTPQTDSTTGLRKPDFLFPFSTEMLQDLPKVGDLPRVQKGDRIIRIGDRPTSNLSDLVNAVESNPGAPVEVTVERSSLVDPKAPPQAVKAYLAAELYFDISETANVKGFSLPDSKHLLGFIPRVRFGQITTKGGPADEAGFQPGDTVLEWGTRATPRFTEILDSIKNNDHKPITVRVERDQKPLTLTVTPRPLSGAGDGPRIGAELGLHGERDEPVIADIFPDTPAAELNIPRGARILSIDDRPVQNWGEVLAAFLPAAGHSIKLRYRTGADEQTATMRIPASLVNDAGVPALARITEVDGKSEWKVETPKGSQMLSVAQDPVLRAALHDSIGKTVTLRYFLNNNEPPRTTTFAVTAENYDPWQMRANYRLPVNELPKVRAKTVLMQAHNPVEAAGMGVDVLRNQLTEVYLFLKQIMTRKMGVQNMAGPVGIVSMAIEQARVSFSDLLFFLAFLSANLAVLNFLPIPVLDGGLMVFLLIEKFKGKPLSFKTQMISTLVGLAAILLVVVFVTIQDISRLFQ